MTKKYTGKQGNKSKREERDDETMGKAVNAIRMSQREKMGKRRK